MVSPTSDGNGATFGGGVVMVTTSPGCPGDPVAPCSPCGPCSQPIMLTTTASTRSGMDRKCRSTAMTPPPPLNQAQICEGKGDDIIQATLDQMPFQGQLNSLALAMDTELTQDSMQMVPDC